MNKAIPILIKASAIKNLVLIITMPEIITPTSDGIGENF